MARLTIGNLPEELIQALKQLAARHKRTAEEEHREILRAALAGPRRVHLASVLAAIPHAGRDEDFARTQSDSRPVTA